MVNALRIRLIANSPPNVSPKQARKSFLVHLRSPYASQRTLNGYVPLMEAKLGVLNHPCLRGIPVLALPANAGSLGRMLWLMVIERQTSYPRSSVRRRAVPMPQLCATRKRWSVLYMSMGVFEHIGRGVVV